MSTTAYRPTIGIECHVQLATKSKLFSPADNDARDAEPNSKIHPVDVALPGMLPRLNHQAIVLAARAAKALNAEVAHESRFDRKHYFYPDLPSGYQITQMYHPTILAGSIEVPLDDGSAINVRIHHAHLESDAGKLTHRNGYSVVDLNRAGTPLIEIVSEPDMHSPEEARAYSSELYRLMTYAEITHGDLYHGNMRFDVNVSIAPVDSDTLGTRVEIKNLNSFRSVERAAAYEIARQQELLESGESVVQETRGWNDDTGVTTSQRSKENAQDYRYMPDPDIPPVVLTQADIDAMQQNMPVLPPEYRKQFAELSVDKSVVAKVMQSRSLASILSAVLSNGSVDDATRVAHWIASKFAATDSIDVSHAVDVGAVLELSRMVGDKEIASNAASELFSLVLSGETDPRALAGSRGLLQNSNQDEIAAIVDRVLADPSSAKAIQDIQSGNDKAIGYLVGQVMKLSRGQANPEMAQTVIREKIVS